MSKKVSDLAKIVDGHIIGDPNLLILGITNLQTPGPGLITFLQDAKRLAEIENSEISCLIVPPSIPTSKKTLIQVKDPKLAWAKLLAEFHPPKRYSKTISPLAYVAKTAKLGKNVTLEPFAVLGESAVIGDESVIGTHAVVGEGVTIGSQSILHAHATVYDHCRIGSRVILHAGVVIGSDGFGYVHTPEKQEKIPQVGNVIIEDDVEIGASTTIDRATVGSTVIGRGCKLDNLVQIGHNVILGAHTVISAQTGISGSCKIGSHVTMGGKVGVGDHVEIGDWTMIGAGAGLPTGKKVPARQIYFGEPARPYQEARKQIAAQLRSAETLEDLRKLRRQFAELEKQIERMSAAKS